MIGTDYARTMARYNRWQNESLYAAAEALGDADRRADRGAFFASIHGTLAHLLWADRMWMSRIAGWDKPPGGIAESVALISDWPVLRAARAADDGRLVAWADGLSPLHLAGDLAWYSGGLEREVQRPAALCVAHLFNHQTHHRGQVHAMLTAAGARPAATDLFAMPGA